MPSYVVEPRYRDLYTECASPESIAANLKKAEARRAHCDREVKWLAELLDTRNAQVEVGLWPPKSDAAELEASNDQ